MLKKIVPFIFAVAAALLPAAPAAAWEQVCMKLPLGKAAFAATFTVVHGFWAHWGIPNAYNVPGERLRRPVPPELNPYEGHNPADGAIVSGSIVVNKSKCVDISGVENGEPFIVYVDSGWYGAIRLCETHRNNPDKWYFQQNRPYRTLWYEAWGVASSPKCAFVRESN